MRHSIPLTSALFVLIGCSPDLIRHDAGLLEAPEDAGFIDAAAPLDASAGLDAGAPDAKGSDAGATSCALAFFPEAIELPRVEVGQTSTASAIISNAGFDSCRFTADVTGVALSITNALPEVLPSGESMQVDLLFAPRRPGYYTGHIEVDVVGGGFIQGTAVSGEGYLTDVPSTRTVTFEITNSSGADRYLVLEGRDCLGLDPGVPQRLSFQCGCECPPPPAAGPLRLLRVPAGATRNLTWDTRALTTWEVPIPCGPGETVTETRGALAPVPDSTYPVRIAYEETVPAFCSSSGNDTYECDPTSDVPEGPPLISTLCDTDDAVLVSTVVGPNDSTTSVTLP